MEFILRVWKTEDANALSAYANNKKIADNLRDGFPHPYTMQDARTFIQTALQGGDKQHLMRAIEINGEAVGSIGVFPRDDVYRKSAEIGYWLGEPFWGKGIMSAAIRQMCALAFAQYNIVRIFAEPFAPNIGSCRALEKAGFVLEGTLKNSVCKNDALLDSLIYALVL